MKILWIDVGSAMGWAHNSAYTGRTYSEGTPEISFGTWKFDGIRAHRQWALMAQFEAFLRGLPLDVVGYERPFSRGLAATSSLWGMAGVIEAVATKRGLPVVDIPPAAIKKFWTGKGTASKEAMIAEAHARLDLKQAINEHEADAIAGLHYALKEVRIGK